MSTTEQLAQRIANNPFLGFLKLRGAERQVTVAQLPFEPLLKNHVGTLHAGALFATAFVRAQAEAQAVLGPGVNVHRLKSTSSIQYKRPGKGPVWCTATAHQTEAGLQVQCVLHSETDEPLAVFNTTFSLTEV